MNTKNLRYVLSAEDRASTVFQRVRSEIAGAGKDAAVLGRIIGPLGARLAGPAVLAAVGAWANRVAEGVDALNDLKDATGASIENLSALEDVALRTGTSLDTAGAAVLKLNQTLNAAKNPDSAQAKAIRAIGLSVEELKRMDPVKALQQVGISLARFADDGNKGRIILELLGKSAKDLAPLLNNLATAGELRAKVTTEQAAAAQKLRKEFFELEKNALDLSRSLAGPLVSGVNSFAAAIRGGGFTQDLDNLLSWTNLAGNAFRGLGVFIGGAAAQAAALARGDLKAAAAIGQAMLDAAKASREELARAAKLKDLLATVPQASYSNEGRNYPGPKLPDTPDKPDLAAAKKAAEERRKLAEFAALQIVTVEEQAAKDAAEAWGFWEKSQLDAQKARADVAKLQWQQVFDFIDAEQERAIEEGQAFLDAQLGIKKTGAEVGKELGLVFASAAGEAITHWQGVSGLLKGILQDLAQIAVRETVTKPLGSMLTSALSDFSFGSLFGGGRASGGPVSAGRIYEVNERGGPGELLNVGSRQYLLAGRNGNVTPQGAGGGPVIYQTNNYTNVNRNELALWSETTKRNTIAAIVDAQRRGFSQ